MNKLHRRLGSAALLGALLPFAFIGTAAFGTQGTGLSASTISVGTFEELDINAARLDKWDLKLKSKGPTEVRVSRLTFIGGGQSGWHTHPGPGLITVTSGSIVAYDGGDPLCPSKTYNAGDTLIDEGGDDVHLIRNASSTAGAEMVVVSFFPSGAAGRVDAPKPNNCP